MENWLDSSWRKGVLKSHDVVVGKEIAKIVTGAWSEGGPFFTEQEILDAERSSFLKLCKTSETQERIRTMLDDGQPLRN